MLRSSSFRLKPVARGLGIGVGLAALSAVQAAPLVQTTSYSFSGGASVTDASGGGATTTSLSGSTLVTQFNSATGVLTGTTIQLNSTRTQTISGSGTDNTSKTQTATATGDGLSKNFNFSGSGFVSTPINISTTAGCTAAAGQGNDCSFGPSQTLSTTNVTVLLAGTDAYVGGGTVLLSRGASLVSATGKNIRFDSSTTTYQLDWAGSVDVSYTYLLHSNASFSDGMDANTLVYDFGMVTQNAADPTLGFSLFNFSADDPNTVGLDLDSFSETDAGNAFSTNLAAFLALAAGGSGGPFSVTFDTANLGVFSASYSLNFSDANVGAASSRQSSPGGLTITVRGQVVAPQQVPEPGTLLLFSTGLLGLGLAARRRKS